MRLFCCWLLLPVTACVALLGGCQAEPPAAEHAAPPAARPTELEAQVLNQHDSLMILTDRLFALRRRLTARRAALPVADRARLGPRLDSATRATLRADDAMMDWMHAYHRPAPDSATAYFRQQLRRLAAVDLLTRRALDSGAAVLRAPLTPVAPPTP